jgi:hypothetical protein
MKRLETPVLPGVVLLAGVASCQLGCGERTQPPAGPVAVGAAPTRAQAEDGTYISWREHIVDDESVGGVPIRGGDGLVVADLDLDGYQDVVSVHESDTIYGVPVGHVRIAFGSDSPDCWQLATLAEGAEAAGAEDVAVADANRDGYPDVVVACELAHLIYFQNPGKDARTARWQRVVPPATIDRGSYIRVFLADFDGNGQPEVVAPNKGAQNTDFTTQERRPISWFQLPADPLAGEGWIEHELTRVVIPINSHPVDLDGDGDMDVVAGSRGEFRIFWFENVSEDGIAFVEHAIQIDGKTSFPEAGRPPQLEGRDGAVVTGHNLAFTDLSGDGRLDVVLAEARNHLVWLEQPSDPGSSWKMHSIGDTYPDHMTGFALADINGDGRPDVMTGGYSQGPRDHDGDVNPEDALGRLAWFEHPEETEGSWARHDISRRKRGMFDQFVARDMDGDGDVDFLSTRGNSAPYDGVFWLEQVRTAEPSAAFAPARETDSAEMPLPS